MKQFDELQLVGTKIMRYSIEAKQYPEMLRIQDMLSLAEGLYLISSAEEWEELSRVC